MTRDTETQEMMCKGMEVLRETLGIVEAEKFIVNIKTTKFDYTKWRETQWEEPWTLDELIRRAKEVEEKYGVPEGVEVI